MRGKGRFTFSSFVTSRSSCLSASAQRSMHAADDVLDELLGQLLQAVEIEERDLRLDHPELGEMAARLRLLGAERRAEAVDLAERRRRGLEVELAGLREVRLLAEVVGLEQRRRPLGRVGGEDRRVDEDEVAVVEEVADGLLDLVADRAARSAASSTAARDGDGSSGSRCRAPSARSDTARPAR